MVVEVRIAGSIGTLVLVVILKLPARVGLAFQVVLIRILHVSVSGGVYPLDYSSTRACPMPLPHEYPTWGSGSAC